MRKGTLVMVNSELLKLIFNTGHNSLVQQNNVHFSPLEKLTSPPAVDSPNYIPYRRLASPRKALSPLFVLVSAMRRVNRARACNELLKPDQSDYPPAPPYFHSKFILYNITYTSRPCKLTFATLPATTDPTNCRPLPVGARPSTKRWVLHVNGNSCSCPYWACSFFIPLQNIHRYSLKLVARSPPGRAVLFSFPCMLLARIICRRPSLCTVYWPQATL